MDIVLIGFSLYFQMETFSRNTEINGAHQLEYNMTLFFHKMQYSFYHVINGL